jgi:hypothetical protein
MRTYLIMLLLLMTLPSIAGNKLSGSVTEADNKTPIMSVTMRLFSADSILRTTMYSCASDDEYRYQMKKDCITITDAIFFCILQISLFFMTIGALLAVFRLLFG